MRIALIRFSMAVSVITLCLYASVAAYGSTCPVSDTSFSSVSRIRGIVEDSRGNPIENVSVGIRAMGDIEMTHTTTDRYGSYEVGDLPSGLYTVSFSCVDIGCENDQGALDETVISYGTIPLAAHQVFDGVNAVFPITPLVSIVGTVTDSHDTPLGGTESVKVSFVSETGGILRAAMTDRNGYYELKRMRTGTTGHLRFDYPEYLDISADEYLRNTRYETRFFSIVSDHNPRFDYVFRKTKKAVISGYVRDTLGNSLPHVSVSYGDERHITETDADGHYSLSVYPRIATLTFAYENDIVDPDEQYRLVGSGSHNYQEDPRTSDVTQDTVFSRDTLADSERPVRDASIEGVVSRSDGQTLSGVTVLFHDAKNHYIATRTDENGAYSLTVSAGTGMVVVTLPSDLVRSILTTRTGDGTGTEIPVYFEEIQQSTVVRAVARNTVTKNAIFPLVAYAPIHGIVRDTTGNPIENVVIHTSDTYGTPLLSTRTNDNGEFTAYTLAFTGRLTVDVSEFSSDDRYFPITVARIPFMLDGGSILTETPDTTGITVSDDSEGIVITLASRKYMHVSGNVRDEFTNGMAGTSVSLISRSGSIFTTMTDENGNYRLLHVPNDSYTSVFFLPSIPTTEGTISKKLSEKSTNRILANATFHSIDCQTTSSSGVRVSETPTHIGLDWLVSAGNIGDLHTQTGGHRIEYPGDGDVYIHEPSGHYVCDAFDFRCRVEDFHGLVSFVRSTATGTLSGDPVIIGKNWYSNPRLQAQYTYLYGSFSLMASEDPDRYFLELSKVSDGLVAIVNGHVVGYGIVGYTADWSSLSNRMLKYYYHNSIALNQDTAGNRDILKVGKNEIVLIQASFVDGSPTLDGGIVYK